MNSTWFDQFCDTTEKILGICIYTVFVAVLVALFFRIVF